MQIYEMELTQSQYRRIWLPLSVYFGGLGVGQIVAVRIIVFSWLIVLLGLAVLPCYYCSAQALTPLCA